MLERSERQYIKQKVAKNLHIGDMIYGILTFRFVHLV